MRGVMRLLPPSGDERPHDDLWNGNSEGERKFKRVVHRATRFIGLCACDAGKTPRARDFGSKVVGGSTKPIKSIPTPLKL
jgi:hypothetical protein